MAAERASRFSLTGWEEVELNWKVRRKADFLGGRAGGTARLSGAARGPGARFLEN